MVVLLQKTELYNWAQHEVTAIVNISKPDCHASKKSHYKKKYGISPSDCQHKLRVLIWIGGPDPKMLKQQLLNDMPKTSQDCSMEIHCKRYLNSQELESIFQANENCKSFSHTIIMFDEIWR